MWLLLPSIPFSLQDFSQRALQFPHPSAGACLLPSLSVRQARHTTRYFGLGTKRGIRYYPPSLTTPFHENPNRGYGNTHNHCAFVCRTGRAFGVPCQTLLITRESPLSFYAYTVFPVTSRGFGRWPGTATAPRPSPLAHHIPSLSGGLSFKPLTRT